ncbi:MAG: serine/threonine-protein kinase [Candidatus Eiseniibacteriota bacterium]
MSADQDPVDRLLASIADDALPDWESAEREDDPARRARIDSLRDVARIAEFSRHHQRAGGLSPGEPGAVLERWGDLLLLERLSLSPHAEVYRAWDPGLQREVALKLVRSSTEDEALLDEGRIAARVRHPHVVAVHGVDRREGRIGLWMELVRGPSLEQEVRAQGPLDAAEARRLGIEIGSALVAMHAAGLLHRDIKPANVIRGSQGGWVLADFGLGMREGDAASTRRPPSGTPMYMAPELLQGDAPSERSDLYSLGMLLWFALTGRHPFPVDTLAELVTSAHTGPRPRLRELRPAVPAKLTTIVERAIEPRPEDRFENVRAAVVALEELSPGTRRLASVRTRAWVGAAVVIVLAAGVVFGLRTGKREESRVPSVAPPSTTVDDYSVEASFLRREPARSVRLIPGDRVKPGDRLSLEVRTTRRAWIYVLNEDENGERYVLFPNPRLDAQNPLAPESTFILPGTVGSGEHAWTVTSAGGREHFLVVVSPEPVPEIEADLDRYPLREPGRPISYAPVGDASLEVLRGVGSMARLPRETARPSSPSRAFERFRSLAGRETGIRGIWVRQIVFENPRS